MFKKLLNDTRGATAVEYGLIVACLSLVIMVGVQLVGNSMQDLFFDVATELEKTD